MTKPRKKYTVRSYQDPKRPGKLSLNRFNSLLLAAAILLGATPCRGQVAVALSPIPRQVYFCSETIAGASVLVPCAGGTLTFFNAGTSVTGPVYTDSTGTFLQTNPVVLDTTGAASPWLVNQGYDVVLKDSNGVQQWKILNVNPYQILISISSIILQPQTVDPAGQGGQLIYRSDIPCLRFFTTGWDCVVTLTAVQTLSSKTLNGATLNSPVINTPAIGGPSTGTGVQGTDAKLLTSGVISASAGIGLCTDASGGATTSGCAAASVNTVSSDGTATTVNANTASAQNLKSFAFGAGALNTIGKAFRVRGSGVYVPVNNTETVQINVTIGTVNLSLAQVPSVALGTGQWYWEFSCITQTTGVTGTVSCNGLMTLQDSAAIFKAQNIATLAGGSTINLTLAQTIQFTVSFSTASATNTCTQDTITVEAMN